MQALLLMLNHLQTRACCQNISKKLFSLWSPEKIRTKKKVAMHTKTIIGRLFFNFFFSKISKLILTLEKQNVRRAILIKSKVTQWPKKVKYQDCLLKEKYQEGSIFYPSLRGAFKIWPKKMFNISKFENGVGYEFYLLYRNFLLDLLC